MAKHRNPAERSVTAPPRPGEAAAKPTGDEVFKATAPAAAQGDAHLPDEVDETPPTMEEQLSEDTLLGLAERYYGRLTETAEMLSSQASEAYDQGRVFVRDNPGRTVLGAVVAGIIIGVLTSRR